MAKTLCKTGFAPRVAPLVTGGEPSARGGPSVHPVASLAPDHGNHWSTGRGGRLFGAGKNLFAKLGSLHVLPHWLPVANRAPVAGPRCIILRVWPQTTGTTGPLVGVAAPLGASYCAFHLVRDSPRSAERCCLREFPFKKFSSENFQTIHL